MGSCWPALTRARCTMPTWSRTRLTTLTAIPDFLRDRSPIPAKVPSKPPCTLPRPGTTTSLRMAVDVIASPTAWKNTTATWPPTARSCADNSATGESTAFRIHPALQDQHSRQPVHDFAPALDRHLRFPE